MNNNRVLARNILWSFLLFVFVSWPGALQAGWPTTPDSALFVDFGLYPYLAVDEHDQSITVIYIRDANRLWAKKYDRYGDPLWGGNAVVLADTTRIFGRDLSNLGNQWGAVVSDDSGGAIVCWEDFRHSTYDGGVPMNNEIYIQRVDVNGQIRFGVNGKRISSPASAGWHELGDMKPDYHGGFVVGFNNDSTNTKSTLKRFSITSSLLWEKFYNGSYFNVNTTDRDGNIFISFQSNNRRQKLDLSGNHLWPDNLIGSIPGSKLYRAGGTFSDMHGGAIGVGDTELKINRVDSSGQYIFGPNGIDLGGGQFGRIGYAPDGAGGIYVSWTRNGSRLQRITNNGSVSFSGNGLLVPPDSINFGADFIVSDFSGGVLYFFVDNTTLPDHSYYIQKIDSSGQFLWDSLGVWFYYTVGNAGFALSARPFYSDMRGGAIYVWAEQQPGFGVRIFLKQISRDGNLGEVITSLKAKHKSIAPDNIKPKLIYPNPFNNSVTIEFIVNKAGLVRVEIYDILGKRIYTLIDSHLHPNTYKIEWNGTDRVGESVSSGIYFCRLSIDSRNSVIQKMLFIK